MRSKFLDVDRSQTFYLRPRLYHAREAGFYYGFFLWWSFWIWTFNLKKS